MKYYPPRYLFRRYEIMRRVNSGEQFIEIGPGQLDLAQELLTKFSKGTLIDFNTTEIERIYYNLAETYKQKLILIIDDFIQYDEFNSKFDCVVACEVLEHIEDDTAFLRKASDILVDHGQLILSVPARQKFWAKHDEIAGHYRRYEKQELYGKLAETGYSQIQIVSYGYPFQNVVRLGRVALARVQYNRKAKWNQKMQTQKSAFMVKRNPYLNLIGLFVNKYTLYPFNLFASLFNRKDLGEGYVVSANKSAS
jgi:cyclopropane fatty-acyl-phospholipid synthase-like methyltransferase